MQQRFCDVCGEPATDGTNVDFTSDDRLKIGPKENSNERGALAVRTRVQIHVNFSFKNHPTGFGGPPDLCAEHRLRLFSQALASINIKPETKDVQKVLERYTKRGKR